MAIVKSTFDPKNLPEPDPEFRARMDAMTPEQIEQNALDDPDNPPMTEAEADEGRRILNLPVWLRPVWWDQYRNVRLTHGRGGIGLATTTYSYNLSFEEREQAARRIAALWNLAALNGWDTETIERMVEEKRQNP